MERDTRQELGKSGEDLACEELRRRGYAILARRFRTRSGELDIVARHGETLVFVEVKARGTSRYGDGADAVTWRKRQRMVRLAHEFVAWSRLDALPCRFDVVSVSPKEGRGPRVEVYPGAFAAGE